MWLSFVALSSIVPAVAQGFRGRAERDAVFWASFAVGIAGPVLWVLVHSSTAWQTGLAATLWVTIAATMTLYAVVAATFRQAWRLAPLLAGYMLLLGLGAVVWHNAGGGPMQAGADARAWVDIHIATAVVTYGLVTIAAVAAFAAFLQERTLKRKRSTVVSRSLPSIADCDSLQFTLLQYGEAVLAMGLATGMGLLYRESGEILLFNHKIVLTVAAFVVIGALLIAHRWAGIRGKRAARLILLGYLLLTLGYPGVKFVTDVLLA
ncbi:MAG: cytochrome c biogenesis protein CcsA [Rhodospirillales bacterium]|nr:cytochrome c biogenesis protein CcsA [Rhodospirillales bacterium]